MYHRYLPVLASGKMHPIFKEKYVTLFHFRVLFIIKSLCTALIISFGQMLKSGIAVYSPFSSIHQHHSLNIDHVLTILRI